MVLTQPNPPPQCKGEGRENFCRKVIGIFKGPVKWLAYNAEDAGEDFATSIEGRKTSQIYSMFWQKF